jgi:hypothetical protein
MREGKGYTFCEALYKRLQRYTPKQLGSCVPSVAMDLPGMKELDGWVELDPRKYKDLYKQLTQLEAKYSPALQRTDDWIARDFQSFVESGGRMRTTTVWVFRHPLAEPNTTYDRPQTVVEVRVKTNREICPDSPALSDIVRTYYVNPDLSAPSQEVPRLESSTARLGRLVQYKGKVRMLYGTTDIDVWRMDNDGMLRSYCEIQAHQFD